MAFITLNITCFDKDTVKKIKLLFNNKYVASLPIRKNIFSLIRSPHIFNKSHEQFKLKRYKLVINIPLKSIDESNKYSTATRSIKDSSFFRYLVHKVSQIPDTEITIYISHPI